MSQTTGKSALPEWYVGKNGFQIVTLLGELFWNILQTINIVVVVGLETLSKAQQVSLCSFIPLLKRECHEIYYHFFLSQIASNRALDKQSKIVKQAR